MDRKELLRVHPSIRDHLAMVVWPIIGIVVVNFVLKRYIWDTMTWPWMLVVAGVLLLFPAYAWLRTRFYTYIVYERAVSARKGLLSKDTSEIRIADIRAIHIQQSLFDRIMNVGRMAFSSAAGDAEEVVFHGVHSPESVKRLVQEQMPDHDAVVDDGE